MNRIFKPSFINYLFMFGGFGILFGLYHLPEVFQNHYQQPLLWLLETGMLLFVLAAYFIGKRKHKNGFHTFGLFALRKHWPNLLKGLVLGVCITLVANLVPVWMQWNKIYIHLELQQILLQLLLFAIGTLLPSLAEDILTRGYLMAHWPVKWNPNHLIMFSALVYVLNHITRLGKPDVMLYLFVLGLVLMWAFVATGSLWLTLGIHWGGNVAYQFFANAATYETIRDTGMENYVLAACFALGFIVIFLLSKRGYFTSGYPLRQFRESNDRNLNN